MTNFWKRWAVLLVALILLAAMTARRTVWSLRLPRRHATRTSAPAPAPGEVGARIPEFTLKDVSGHEVSSEQFRGRVLLVDFWATWCGPCRVEMPAFQGFQDRYRARGLAVMGIALDTDPAEVTRFAKELRVRYTLLMNRPEVEKQFGGVLGIPTTILVDRDGIIRKKVIGFEHKDVFEAALEEIL